MIELVTMEQLQNCMLAKMKVQIWVGSEYDETVILEVSNEIIKASNNFYYFRENCTIYVSGNYFRLVK